MKQLGVVMLSTFSLLSTVHLNLYTLDTTSGDLNQNAFRNAKLISGSADSRMCNFKATQESESSVHHRLKKNATNIN